jgi:hypothetical protein
MIWSVPARPLSPRPCRQLAPGRRCQGWTLRPWRSHAVGALDADGPVLNDHKRGTPGGPAVSLTPAADTRNDENVNTPPPRMTYTQGGFWHWLLRGPRARRFILGVVVGLAVAVTLQYFWADPSTPVIRTVFLCAWLVLIWIGVAYWQWRSGGRQQ